MNAVAQATTPKQEFLGGIKAILPLLLGVIPFGMIFGALAVNAQMPSSVAQAMSAIVFAGSAQFIAAQMVGTGASGVVIVLVILVVNLRHVLYSASVAPYLRQMRPAWKWLLAYLLTDEAYAVTISHYNQDGDPTYKHWFYLGTGLTLWVTWQISTLVGIQIGAQMPEGWPINFVLPVTFIALVIPALKDRAATAAALVAGLAGLLASGMPLRTGLLLASLLGIVTGMLVEGRRR